MLMAVQFQGFEQGGVLGFPAQITGGQYLHSRLNMYYFASLGYRVKFSGSYSNQALVLGFRPLPNYCQNLSEARSQGGLESRFKPSIDACSGDGFPKRLQHPLSHRLCELRFYAPNMIPPIIISYFRELCRAGYDLTKTIISKLIHYTTRQDAEFNNITFKED